MPRSRSPGLTLAAVDTFIHGTTLATNAIIERRGAKTALIATDGFRDTLEIGTESRYDQYELALVRPNHWCRGRCASQSANGSMQGATFCCG